MPGKQEEQAWNWLRKFTPRQSATVNCRMNPVKQPVSVYIYIYIYIYIYTFVIIYVHSYSHIILLLFQFIIQIKAQHPVWAPCQAHLNQLPSWASRATVSTLTWSANLTMIQTQVLIAQWQRSARLHAWQPGRLVVPQALYTPHHLQAMSTGPIYDCLISQW